MARPEEKAQNMMNKWVKMKEQGEDFDEEQRRKRRPFLASHCEHLHDAEKWRRQIIREITDGIRKIQNPGLGEHAIRDLNDHINKLIREKWHWNRRIVELGGPDFNAIERKEQIAEGDIQSGMGLKGSGGYRYFGAAKDLPGVKELFARHAAKVTKRRRGNVKYITPDYYGLRDEEDGVLLELEEEASEARRRKLSNAREEYRAKILEDELGSEESEEEGEGVGGVTGAADAIAAHVAVPTQDIVRSTVLERKKKELLNRLIM
uniref:Pre-mRNA-splicing factor ISY1 n=1 Tax=Odontella aurita TaxID=265563 RepID=A0A6U6JJR7_9STRA|mmetsp:Transcript_57432/g.171321  ORF Transcript_57432/g.171321 Transcript_57432/m.171321 type:complete len:263 (+) Transcript_57432:273-1061(+)|eukprot:CAMPEP_0113566468 /NCGR_PEP_ID=MMETSP0015_2-20120614/22740_1 /TAXON_ID=2838 /ORGANISM="Odontella" /LENGTH=262 /DNA_ID=CAMNT_0000468761 /DNA_START=201 /DNA_END=989 /DNA_ORIENTATION=- /assembly_acc=CAM_ASM_000160